ncbi:MAG TPA: hypothetical protein VNK23_14280 [Candidatus Dormibacteraeota bacterium]|nr:hypothetical protein [Candidatus Dormibacteraeota bacterium]
MRRPAGITIIAIVGLLLGALLALAELLIVFRGRWLVISEFSFGHALGGAVLAVIAALLIGTSIGLLLLEEWARILAIVLNAVHLVIAALGLFDALRNIHMPFFVGMMFRHIVMLVIGIWIIVYLISPRVKRAFGSTAPTAT